MGSVAETNADRAAGAPWRGGAARGRLASIGAGVAAFAAAALALLYGIGWFGGPLYFDLPSQAAGRPRVVAILFSGDMGFHFGMGAQVADRLAARGIPVVGVNSLTFFRSPRSLAETARLIEGGMKRAAALAPGAKLVLIGQSFGADMLQVGLTALPAGPRRQIAMVALVVPSREARLQASPSDLFPMSSPLFDAVPTARRLDWAPALCVQGVEQDDSLCPLLGQPNAVRVALPGGHLLHRDPERLAATLLAAIRRSAGPAR